MKPVYFKTYTKAVEVAKKVPDALCVNQYQWSNETKCAKVREFDRGFAVQLGDCGPYVTKETMIELDLK
jgi:hypothetical protein